MTPSRLVASLGLIVLTASPAFAGDLHAYVGAGLRQPVSAIAEAFEKETGNKVQLEFGGSGQILARFEETGHGICSFPDRPYMPTS
ncbi:substrate-binding domain-containing protein [Breoghania sp.]|uniref:substrate-binding domain-containing protein n=1 Tax=Breoghania sp. TaxID=2065378 RepID=UPI003204B1FD